MAPHVDLESRQALVGVITRNVEEANAGTGQTPMIVRSLADPEISNPYADRGFKRGQDTEPKIRKFLCYFSLSQGLLFSAFYDVVQVMVWVTLVFANIGSIHWLFYLFYLSVSIGRLHSFYKFNKEDTELMRYKLYKAHRISVLALSIGQLLQLISTLISQEGFPAS